MATLFDPTTKNTLGSPNPRVAAEAAKTGFDQMATQISSWCLVEHNANGTHKIPYSSLGSGGDGKGSHYLGDNLQWQSLGVVPTGGLMMYAGATAPSGWLLCDGSAVSRITYNGLFAAIGTTYGAGNGTSTFNLPDLRGRVPIGAGTGSGLTTRAVGTNYGEETHIITVSEMPAHAHPGSTVAITDPGHTHPVIYNQLNTNIAAGSTPANFTAGGASTFNTNSATTGITATPTIASQGSGTGHNNIQPSLGVNYIIKF